MSIPSVGSSFKLLAKAAATLDVEYSSLHYVPSGEIDFGMFQMLMAHVAAAPAMLGLESIGIENEVAGDGDLSCHDRC